jgi:transcriptional regulator with XRE-family HTH domain
MAERIGMSLRSYRRLELGEVPNPPLRTLADCALALGVPLAAVVEPNWLEWSGGPFGSVPEPGPGGFWPQQPQPAWDSFDEPTETSAPPDFGPAQARLVRSRSRPDWLGPLPDDV